MRMGTHARLIPVIADIFDNAMKIWMEVIFVLAPNVGPFFSLQLLPKTLANAVIYENCSISRARNGGIYSISHYPSRANVADVAILVTFQEFHMQGT